MKLITPWLLVLSGVFLLCDRLLKWAAVHTWKEPALLGSWFGWRPFFNPGVAFGLPVPYALKIVLSVLIIALFVRSLASAEKHPLQKIGLVYIVFGALSNLYDRLAYHITVDYLQLLTGIFNIADFMIIIGFIFVLWIEHKQKVNHTIN